MSPTHFPTIPVDQVPKDFQDTPALILIVDDERIIADTMSAIFKRSGFNVMTAYDGASALALAAQASPQLLITDVVMPGMSGIELAMLIAETVPACEIIVFSGQASTMDLLSKAREAGHNFTALTKPVHPTVMLAEAAQRLNLNTKHRDNVIPITSGYPHLSSSFESAV